MNKPCLRCGDLTPDTYCQDCKPPTHPKTSPRTRGYDKKWERLSQRLRKHAVCSVCGTRDDLQLDHLEGAWERVAAGKKLRPGIDVDVKCGRHNREAGARRTLNPGGQTPAAPRGDARGQAGKAIDTPGGYAGRGES